MPRITVNVSDETEAWIESEADALGVSKARVGGHCIEVMQNTVDHINLNQTDAVVDEADDLDTLDERVTKIEDRLDTLSDAILDRVDDLEDRIDDLEEQPAVSTSREDTGDASTGQERRETPPDVEADPSPVEDTAPRETAASTPAEDKDKELPDDVDHAVRDAVREVTASWEDSPDRLETRRQAAAVVLQYALSTGEPVGKSSEIVETVRDVYPVDGQNAETYWRKNIRDVLSEFGAYNPGRHGYVVDESDLA